MIVCSCNIVSRKDIEQVVVDFLTEDEWQLITPGKVFQAMSARGKCCGCFPGVIDIIVETTEHYHGLMQSPAPKVVDLLSPDESPPGSCRMTLMVINWSGFWNSRLMKV